MRRSFVKQNPSFNPSSSSVSGLMLPLRSSVYILKSEPGNERGSAHFRNFQAARGFVYQLRRCETSRGDDTFSIRWAPPIRGATGKFLSRRIYRNGLREKSNCSVDDYVTVSAVFRPGRRNIFSSLEITVRLFKVWLQRNPCVQIVVLPNHQ